MPAKRKDFLKPSVKAKSKAPEPQSENDFLDAADEHEQSAGKWRAGDAAKATRFFNRAIDVYNAGLQKYPSSFDLAYNKANLEYHMIEDDRIVALLGSKVDLLQETLKSHRTAIALNPENTDVLFNTGQVLVSLSEVLTETGAYDTKASTKELLEEAVEIFAKCLASQYQEYDQMEREIAKATDFQEISDRNGSVLPGSEHSGDAVGQRTMDTSSASSDQPEEWATVVEPVTPESLLETCAVQLGALTALLGLYDSSELSTIEKRAQDGLQTSNITIPALIDRMRDSPFSKSPEEPAPGPVLSIASHSTQEEETSPKDDALLAAANFQARIAEIAYRNSQSNSVDYARRVEEIFTPLISAQSATEGSALNYANALSAYVDALTDIASAISDRQQYATISDDDLNSQWAALTQAQTLLTKLSSGAPSSARSPSKLADVFLARGDSDLFRFRLTLSEAAKPAWVKSKAILVSNAAVFYRGARSYAERAGAAQTQKTANAKAAVAEILKEAASGSMVDGKQWKIIGQDIVRVLEEMVGEGIIDAENAEGVLKCIV